MKASDFDKKFESGEDMTPLLDLTKARRPGLESKRVNVIFLNGWWNRLIKKRID